ncbi:MAG: DMT family transporter [Rhodomicrobium sp.]|nr:DMT family transporter [Rhodomicrobium sp.]
MCAAAVFLAFLDMTAKYLATVALVPVEQITWMRFVTNWILIAAYVGPGAAVRFSETRKFWSQLFRSFLLLGSAVFNFLALQFLQLDQTATISFLSPFFVAALAGPMLNEWIGWRRLLAIGVGFSGVLFVIRPGFGGVHWAISFSVLSTLSYALYSILTRYLARFDTAETTLVYTPLAGLFLVAPFAIMTWQTPQSAWVWFVLLCPGVLGGLAHWLLILAHERAPAPILAPFGYINIIFMIALGYFVFADVPGWWTMAGAAIIISSGIYLLFRERQTSGPDGPASSATVVEG